MTEQLKTNPIIQIELNPFNALVQRKEGLESIADHNETHIYDRSCFDETPVYEDSFRKIEQLNRVLDDVDEQIAEFTMGDLLTITRQDISRGIRSVRERFVGTFMSRVGVRK